MKRLVIGGIHGHWDGFKKIYDLEDPDDVIKYFFLFIYNHLFMFDK